MIFYDKFEQYDCKITQINEMEANGQKEMKEIKEHKKRPK